MLRGSARSSSPHLECSYADSCPVQPNNDQIWSFLRFCSKQHCSKSLPFQLDPSTTQSTSGNHTGYFEQFRPAPISAEGKYVHVHGGMGVWVVRCVVSDSRWGWFDPPPHKIWESEVTHPSLWQYVRVGLYRWATGCRCAPGWAYGMCGDIHIPVLLFSLSVSAWSEQRLTFIQDASPPSPLHCCSPPSSAARQKIHHGIRQGG
jgi:hypothetical protein